MSPTTPLTFTPRLVAKPWGGDRLRALGRDVPVGAQVGESWEVADLPDDATTVSDPVSRVADGPLAGLSLGDLLLRDRDGLLGASAPSPSGRFPLLVKLLDARETLSVQVHPPLSIAADAHKTETWVVLAAEPGAHLLLGVRDGVTADAVAAAAGSASLVPLLGRVAVVAGDVVHVPAGVIHALGAGVLVAEVQTPSDVTYRLYDWAEDGPDRSRRLHVPQAMESIRASWSHNINVQLAPDVDGVLVDTPQYRLERVQLMAGTPVPAAGAVGRPRVLLVVEGAVSWDVAPGPEMSPRRALQLGGVCLLPAACATRVYAGTGGATVLVATPA
ncbi:MAG: mannose-6-phosphate isomerase [Nitriliruptoraceae bacterium]|jgi:mannose-6-phosphate isomerase